MTRACSILRTRLCRLPPTASLPRTGSYKKKPVKVANLQPKGADGDTYSAKKVNRYINRIVLRTWYLDTALKAVLLDRADDMHFMHTAEEIKKQLKGTKMLQVGLAPNLQLGYCVFVFSSSSSSSFQSQKGSMAKVPCVLAVVSAVMTLAAELCCTWR